MAKGNLFLGFGRGKVGDLVFSRVNGEQVARARNRSPRNPQSPLQLLQRVVLKSSSLAFSMLQDICNHSFQGREGVTANQSRFIERNVSLFRYQLRYEINSGDPEEILASTEANFSAKGASFPGFNAYQVSEGKLPSTGFSWNTSITGLRSFTFPFMVNLADSALNCTYQDLIDALDCQVGDQLTFLFCSIDDRTTTVTGQFNGFRYARFILDPKDGDLTHLITDAAYLNEKNEGILTFTSAGGSGSRAYLSAEGGGFGTNPGQINTIAAAACILSREVGGVWARSTEVLSLRPVTSSSDPNGLASEHDVDYLGDAIQSYMTDSSSLLYLNQAET